MDEFFDLPVEFQGKDHLFKASLVTFWHTHKFHVEVNGQTVIFEPDEEKNYRAVRLYEEINSSTKIDPELLKCISNSLEEILK